MQPLSNYFGIVCINLLHGCVYHFRAWCVKKFYYDRKKKQAAAKQAKTDDKV